jgi:signal transduction histidine kinase
MGFLARVVARVRQLPLLRGAVEKVKRAPQVRVRYFIFGGALLLLAAFTLLNQLFLSGLRIQAEAINHKEARLYAVAIAEQLNRDEINVLFNEIVRKSEVPMIITDTSGTPLNWNNLTSGFLQGGRDAVAQAPWPLLPKKDREYLRQRIREMDETNDPLPLEADNKVFGTLHYGDVPAVDRLEWLPIAELTLLFLFFFLGYFGFTIIRSNEQSVLWVGLAKETAHQLGTPISSLLGWIDFLKMKMQDDPSQERGLRILGEMESDISRLNRVATRFSQIGSMPELKEQDLGEIIDSTVKYFSTRLPRFGKKIRIELNLSELPPIWINKELVGWVFENLIRNAVDSIESEDGVIIISAERAVDEDKVKITVEDNGKGIPKENFHHIFSPGFTTKKRGWGLGLSLCRRIVQDYHDGEIFVKRSMKDQGTTFEIVLPLRPERTLRKNHDR